MVTRDASDGALAPTALRARTITAYVCDFSKVLTLTLRDVAEKFDHVAPPFTEY